MAPLPALPPDDFACPECGFDYAGGDVGDAVATVRAGVAQLRAVVVPAAADVRARPLPGTWSVVEYACHVRDVLVTSAVRLHRVVHERDPRVDPMFNDWRAERFRYREEDLPAVLGQIERARDGLLDEVAAVPSDAWDRTGGRAADEPRSARWFVRHAAHEVAHHLQDVRRILGRPPG